MGAITVTNNIRICFGKTETKHDAGQVGLQLNLATPHLGGSSSEVLFESESAEREVSGNFTLLRDTGMLAGIAVVDCDLAAAESTAEKLYVELLGHASGLNLQRLWNFVPYINDETLGQEIYRSFNVGRYKAFAAAYGQSQMDLLLPAATAVGLQESESRLALVFLAGEQPVEYFENPRQIPAYQYPSEFGPVSPSFARGAVVSVAGKRVGYLSGTSSICGCKTVGLGNLEKQFEETIENIKTAMLQMGFVGGLVNTAEFSSLFRVYLRDAADYAEIYQMFVAVVGQEIAEQTAFIQADICRASLKLEIEGVFRQLNG